MIVLDHKSFQGQVVNLDTGQLIRKVRKVWLNDNPVLPGEFEAFRLDGTGKILLEHGKPVTYRGKCRMRLIPKTDKLGTLPTRPRKKPLIRRVGKRLIVPILNRRCEHYACNRLAEWIVSDEVETAPLVAFGMGAMRKWSTGRTIAHRYYCSWHYEPARILDHKGEVVESLENLKARPD